VAALAGLAVSTKRGGVDPSGVPFIWDLTGGEDRGLGAGFDVVDDLRTPPWVFKYTYNTGKTASIGNTLFQIPDGTSAQGIYAFKGQNETKLTTSWSDHWTYSLKTTSISLSANIGNLSLGFAFSGSKGYINQLTKNGTKSFGWNGGIYMTFALQFRGMNTPPLDDDFVRDIKNLPKAYTPLTYGRFLRSWGTHFFSRAIYGCQYNFTASFDNSFTDKKTARWSTTQVDLTLKFNEFQFGVKNAKEVNKSSIDGSFASNVQVTANARGGDELKFVLGKDFDGWIDSCHTQKVPIVLYSDTEPIYTLISDPTIAANVQKAVIAYGTTGKYPGF